MTQPIEKRASYGLFKELSEFLDTNPSKKEILIKFYEIIDKKRGFKSETNSYYAWESLNYLLNEGLLE